MSAIDEARARLRTTAAAHGAAAPVADARGTAVPGAAAPGVAVVGRSPSAPVAAGIAAAGVAFAAVGGRLEKSWVQAVTELEGCVAPLSDDGAPVLWEGGPYPGAWLESTATINAELLDRFAPAVTRDTHLLLARHQREDGLLPYKVTADGPAFSQIQMVTPLARCVWHHYLLTGRSDRAYLSTMYAAMSRHDAWLAAHRDTRATGAVEAFGTFDTGHDGSPRFWFLPERPLHSDASRFDPLVPHLPLIAPDLTANVACQRTYLARIAEELGSDDDDDGATGPAVTLVDGALPAPAPHPDWRVAAASSLTALQAQCWADDDALWYDRSARGDLVRIPSDVLLRVLACEVGDGALFATMLERYLMSTRKFLSQHGWTSLAMDDPRFEPNAARNSWGGPVNFLTMVRAPHAFERHGHVAELALVAGPVLRALVEGGRFPQVLDPCSGEPAYGERYSPSILWFLDAVERTFGILPRADGELWFSGLTPTRLDGEARAAAVAYARAVDGMRFELAGDDERVRVWRSPGADGVPGAGGSADELVAELPRGLRLVTDRTGRPSAVVGLAAGTVRGTVTTRSGSWPVEVRPNERLTLTPDGPRPDPARSPRFVPPQH